MTRDVSLYSGSRFRKAIRAFLLGRTAQGIANLLLILWVVRLLAPGDYGAYMTLRGLVEMLGPLSSLGLLEAARRYMPDLATRGSAQGVRSFVKWTTLTRTVILLIWAAAIVAGWQGLTTWLGFNEAQAQQLWVVAGLVVTIMSFRYASEMLETLLEQRWSQLAHALMPIGRLAGVAILVALDAVTLANVLWVDLAVSVLCLLVAEIALAWRLQRLEVDGNHRVQAREVLAFAWHMAGANLLQALASAGALRILAARLLGLEAAGLFAFLQQLITTVSRYMPAQLLASIIRPMLISRHATGEAQIVGQGVGLMWKSNLLIVMAGVACLAVVGDALIALASGGRFVQAGMLALVLFLGLGATSQGLLINMAMQIHDQTRSLRTQSLLFLLIPLFAWCGGLAGLLGFAFGIVGAQWLRNLFALWWMRRHGVGITLDWAGLGRALLASVAALLAGLLIANLWGPWPALAVIALTLTLAYLFAKPLCAADFELLRSSLKGKARPFKPFVHTR